MAASESPQATWTPSPPKPFAPFSSTLQTVRNHTSARHPESLRHIHDAGASLTIGESLYHVGTVHPFPARLIRGWLGRHRGKVCRVGRNWRWSTGRARLDL